MKASSLVILAFAAATLAAGCGRVVTVDDTDASPIDNTGDSGPISEGGPTRDAEAGPSSEKDADANPGTCADYTPGGGPVGAPGGTECTVAVDVNSGSLVMKHGASGSATLAGNVYQLTCSDGATVLMTATINCYQGPGTYEVPAGALTLGSHVSDRKCQLGIDTSAAGEVRGFIECDNSPADPSNVFANSGPPIGLGDYALPTN